MDHVRGEHSTGVASLSETDEVTTLKKCLTAQDFVDLGAYSKTIKDTKCLIGHNRYATQGAVNAENAHPFTHGSITGVHNGTLTNQRLLDDHAKFVVDSENVVHCINKNGIADTWSKVHGAAALAWIDEDDVTLNLIRNSQRPMFVALINSGETLVFASCEHMIRSAILQVMKISSVEVKEIPINTLHSYSFTEMEYTQPAANYNKSYSYSAAYGTAWGNAAGFIIDPVRTKKLAPYVATVPKVNSKYKHVNNKGKGNKEWAYGEFAAEVVGFGPDVTFNPAGFPKPVTLPKHFILEDNAGVRHELRSFGMNHTAASNLRMGDIVRCSPSHEFQGTKIVRFAKVEGIAPLFDSYPALKIGECWGDNGSVMSIEEFRLQFGSTCDDCGCDYSYLGGHLGMLTMDTKKPVGSCNTCVHEIMELD